MKLYEYELYKNEIIMMVYEVRETEKLYIVQRCESNKPYVQFNAYTRIPKEIVDGNICTSYSNMYFYSLSSDRDNAKKAFINYLQNKKIPACKKDIECAMEKLKKFEEMLDILSSDK